MHSDTHLDFCDLFGYVLYKVKMSTPDNGACQVYTSLWGAIKKKGSTPLSIFIKSQTLKSKKASQSYLSVHFCILHSIPPIHFVIKSYHLYLFVITQILEVPSDISI